MVNYYSIVEVIPSGNVEIENPEYMGTKEKFWYVDHREGLGSNWLFKYPRPNSGEHWAEKIAAEVANLLTTSHARVELAVCENVRGSVSRSFLQASERLVHGNESLSDVAWIYLMDGLEKLYDAEKKYHQSLHTLEAIFEVVSAYGQDESRFADYVVLDAVIGNTDRHHENWGWVKDSTDPYLLELAPSFDHASSLGRELTDERRSRLLTERRVGSYSERARGGIYWSEDDPAGASPLELVRLGFSYYPEIFQPALTKLSELTEENIIDVVSRVPEDWMTALQRTFAVELMNYNLGQLRELLHG